ncbi:uncharacterized protein LOC125769464 [Anopheles funestus]|uniref:uncharacterized protein LOC125769464 n=1 Tax=Anopheles funestus TaxID=62324 RepID=UPI0020C67471|nr:uncharacterized protein LOC125769464 [Anopheles funestus]
MFTSLDSKGTKAKPTKKWIQKYSIHWEQKLSWITKSDKGKTFAYCKICDQHVRSTGGFTDLKRHEKTTKHVINSGKLKSTGSSTGINTFMSRNDKAMNAELQISAWGAEHNISARNLEGFVELSKRIFKDSSTAQNLRLGRTKIQAIQTNVIGRTGLEELLKIIQVNFFSLLVDESTDLSGQKSLAMIVRAGIWQADQLLVHDFFYHIETVVEASAISLYEIISKKLEADGVPYKTNLIGFGSDGANVMMGAHHSVATMIKRDCPYAFIMKCICHSLALCSSYACKHIPCSVEQLCRDVYKFLSSGGQRGSCFKELQTLVELKPLKMLHPSATRWLSLESVVVRMLERYDILQIYFNFKDVRTDKLTREKMEAIRVGLEDPTIKVYLTFLKYILPVINQINKLFQSASPELCRLHGDVSRLYRTILDNFLASEYMADLNELSKVVFSHQNYKALEEMFIGTESMLLMEQYLQSRTLNQQIATEVRTNILNFYVTLCNQITKRIDLSDPIIVQSARLDPKNILNRKFESIYPLVKNFPNLVPESELQAADMEYRELRNIELKDFQPEELTCSVGFWSKTLNVRRADGSLAFPILRRVVPGLLSLPHNTASVERLFSQCNKNKNKLRNRMTPEVLEGLLTSKDYVNLHKTANGGIEITSEMKKKFTSDRYNMEN